MPQTKTSPTIYERLAKIQKELKAPKAQYNKFAKFDYRSCEDILEAVKPLLKGLSLTISDDMVLIGDRYYVKATAALGDCGDGVPSVITSTAYAREALDKKGMDVAQITGSASSYARKYALNGLFAIDDARDADVPPNSTVKAPEAAAPATTGAAKPATPANSGELVSVRQRSCIFALGKDLGHEPEQLKEIIKGGYKLSSFNQLTRDNASDVIIEMRRKLAERQPAEDRPAHEEFTGNVEDGPEGSERVDPKEMPF